MKLFLDMAKMEAIARASDTGLLDGVTPNPTKILETGKPFRKVLEEICSMVSGPVSAEAVADKAEDIVAEALKITPIAPNIAIKVPMTPEGLKACRILRGKDIPVNATMIFAPDQAMLAMKAGVDIVSISEGIFFDLFNHPLTDKGLHDFDLDWGKVIAAGLT